MDSFQIFSIGILCRCQDFLSLLSRMPMSQADFEGSFPRYEGVQATEILSLARCMGWIDIGVEGTIRMTVTGWAIVNGADTSAKLQVQVRDILLKRPPQWIGLLTRGRDALIRYGSMNAVQCFRDAGLLKDADLSTAAWWDSVSSAQRQARDSRLQDIGRRGEWLSIEHELARTGVRPLWTALDDSAAGYDLLSRVSLLDERQLIIEVKASEEHWGAAHFYLSRNEWFVLSTSPRALLHLWSVATSPPRFAPVPIDVLADHVARDNGLGHWRELQVPYTIVSPLPSLRQK